MNCKKCPTLKSDNLCVVCCPTIPESNCPTQSQVQVKLDKWKPNVILPDTLTIDSEK